MTWQRACYVGLLALACASDGVAQSPSPATAFDPAALRRPIYTWTQPERVFGLAHWDAVYAARMVARGARVRPLPAGKPLAALRPGTPGGQAVDRFIRDQQVAGLLILQGGRVRLERYALGHSATGRWTSQSVAKAMTSTLVGVAMKEGFIASLDDPITKYIIGLRGSAYDDVTIRQLLTMTSGVKWNEDYADPESDLARYYVQPVAPGLNATVSYLRTLPREAPPGTRWVYKTGETDLLGVLVTSATRQTLSDYLSTRIWAPYGMEQAATWGTDRTFHEFGGCCLQAGLRDYARFGQLVLDGGRIDGHAIAIDGWFEAATRQQAPTGDPTQGYGYQWWTMEGGSFAAIGIHGQLIYIDPSRRLVVAMNSAWPVATAPERKAARREFLTMITAAVDAEHRR